LRSEEVVKNQEKEGKEERIEVTHDLHREKGKEVSTEASSALTPIENSLLGLSDEQTKVIKVENSLSILLIVFPFMIPFQMRNCLRILRVIYPDL
jgi:uncharacterized protein YjiK